jgi:TPR repeat protein
MKHNLPKSICQFFSVVALLVIFSSSAAANSFETAAQAYAAGDYKQAVKIFSALAENGDAAAQYRLGFMLDEGKGISQSHAEAYAWWIVAAMNGAKDALKNIESKSKQFTPRELEKIRQHAQQIWSRTTLLAQQ